MKKDSSIVKIKSKQYEELEELDKNLESIKERYKRSTKLNYYAGWFFIFTSIVFSILGIITHNPKVLLGIALQLLAGTMLIIVNKE